jgi:hypothetical protein
VKRVRGGAKPGGTTNAPVSSAWIVWPIYPSFYRREERRCLRGVLILRCRKNLIQAALAREFVTRRARHRVRTALPTQAASSCSLKMHLSFRFLSQIGKIDGLGRQRQQRQPTCLALRPVKSSCSSSFDALIWTVRLSAEGLL